MSVFKVNGATGALTPVTQKAETGKNPIAVAFSPGGGLLATANATSDTVSIFKVESSTGLLTPVTQSPASNADAGMTPESVSFSPNGAVLASADYGTDTVSTFTVAESTGAVTPVTQTPASNANTEGFPYAAAFSPAGGLLVVPNQGSSTISLYAVDESNGTLTPDPQSPASNAHTGAGPVSLAFSPSGGLIATANFSASSVSMFAVSGITGNGSGNGNGGGNGGGTPSSGTGSGAGTSSNAGGAGGASAAQRAAEAARAAALLPLRCSGSEVALLSMRVQGHSVILSGLALPKLAGQQVKITISDVPKRYAVGLGGTTHVTSSGAFAVALRAPTGPLAPLTRYTATIAGHASLGLKLGRSVVITSDTPVSAGARVALQVTGALANTTPRWRGRSPARRKRLSRRSRFPAAASSRLSFRHRRIPAKSPITVSGRARPAVSPTPFPSRLAAPVEPAVGVQPSAPSAA